MFKRRDISGKEYLERIEARKMKYRPIDVWRARKLAKKVKEVFEKYPNVASFYVGFHSNVACFKVARKKLRPFVYFASSTISK